MSEHPKPALTGDVILHNVHTDEILLIQRLHDPFKDHWAMPGGFFEPLKDQSVEEGAFRELAEELNLILTPDQYYNKEFFKYFDSPDRDTRDRVITFVFAVELKSKPEVRAGDDAKSYQWFSGLDIVGGHVPLAFDHREILTDYLVPFMPPSPAMKAFLDECD